MKISLFVLAALVVVTHQQFQRQNGMRWMPYSPQRVLHNYYQSPYYDAIDDDDSALYRQVRPSRPISYFQVSPNTTFWSNSFNSGDIISFRMKSSIRIWWPSTVRTILTKTIMKIFSRG